MRSASDQPQKTLLSQVPLFAGLEPAAYAAIEAGVTLKSFPKGTIVVTQDDEAHAMYLVLEGRLRVYRTHEDGKEVLLGGLTNGDYFGELALLDPAPRSASVIVLQPARLAILSRDHLLRCLDQQPELARNLLVSLAARFRLLSVWVSDLASLDVYGRIARFLLDHSQEQNGERLTEPMTQQEIAQHIGASREMVSRIFKELRAGGYIRMRGRQIVIERRLPERW